MIKNNGFLTKALILIVLVANFGCSGRLPVEVVELSYTVGEDIGALHRSYRALIMTHFKNLRRQVERFLQDRWVPVFLADYAKRAKLAEIIKRARSAWMSHEKIDNHRHQGASDRMRVGFGEYQV